MDSSTDSWTDSSENSSESDVSVVAVDQQGRRILEPWMEELLDYIFDTDSDSDSDDSEVSGESEVSGDLQWEESEEEEEEEEEGEDEGEEDQCVPSGELWCGWAADTGFVSLFEEEEKEEEEGEEDNQVVPLGEFVLHQCPSPAQAPPEVSVPRAQSPSPAFRALERIFENTLHPEEPGVTSPSESEDLTLPSAVVPSVSHLDFLRRPCKRSRDEDEEDSSSKRARLSSSEELSTSTGTFRGGFTRPFLDPHLLQEPDSDED